MEFKVITNEKFIEMFGGDDYGPLDWTDHCTVAARTIDCLAFYLDHKGKYTEDDLLDFWSCLNYEECCDDDYAYIAEGDVKGLKEVMEEIAGMDVLEYMHYENPVMD